MVRFREPLSAHTTLGIGGPADVWVKPHNVGELRKIVCFCVRKRIPYLVIGRGSNILFTDKGFKGVVLCLETPAFSKIEVRGGCLFCGAGLALPKLLTQAQRMGLGGLEFLTGIPASIGGALVMNAGSRDESIGQLVNRVMVMDKQGKLKTLSRKKLRFGYRKSNLSRYIVLKVEFRLVKRSPREIKENMATNLSRRKRTQDIKSKSAGCIFKNPPHPLTAAEMIEACGLKHTRRGGAEISARHANYFINQDQARAKDILYLINLVQRRVKRKFGVCLEPEIKIIR